MELNGFTVQASLRVTHHCVIGEDGTVTDQTVPCNYTVGSGSDRCQGVCEPCRRIARRAAMIASTLQVAPDKV